MNPFFIGLLVLLLPAASTFAQSRAALGVGIGVAAGVGVSVDVEHSPRIELNDGSSAYVSKMLCGTVFATGGEVSFQLVSPPRPPAPLPIDVLINPAVELLQVPAALDSAAVPGTYLSTVNITTFGGTCEIAGPVSIPPGTPQLRCADVIEGFGPTQAFSELTITVTCTQPASVIGIHSVKNVEILAAGALDDEPARDDALPPASRVFSCFYECKAGPMVRGIETWQEVTSLVLANQSNAPIMGTVAFLDGNQNILAQSAINLSGEDLDEVNVCRTLEDLMGPGAVPAAGLIEVVLNQVGVYGWVKNHTGKFFSMIDEPFDGRVTSVGKTDCQLAPPSVTDPQVVLGKIANAPVIPPVLIEGTNP